MSGVFHITGITGGQAVVNACALAGVEVVFGYPGGAILPFYDALRDSNIRHILTRGEQAAAHAASGYARVSGCVGVCVATSGPGATNLMTGIAAAFLDSIPLVALTGQVATHLIGRDAFQEVDVIGATAPFCKHNYLVRRAADISRVLAEAFHIAATGRPGPVVVDLPHDVLLETIESTVGKVDLPGYKPTYRGHPMMIKKLREALQKADHPVICAGGGVISSNAAPQLLQFAERIGAPVATSLMGIGAMPKNPLALGMLGIYGEHRANRMVREADLILVLGMRLGERALGRGETIRTDAVVAHVDIDPAEIGKNLSVNLPIVGDVGGVLEDLCAGELKSHDPQWAFSDPQQADDTTSFSPRNILQTVGGVISGATVVTDVGQHQIWASQYLPITRPRQFLTSGGLGAMGYGLPAAIGAALYLNEKVLLVIGDGGLQMSLSELGTLMQQNLPVKVLLINNGGLGMVRELQTLHYEKRHTEVQLPAPDFVRLFSAYNIPGERITTLKQLEEAICRWWDGQAALLECVIDDKWECADTR